jgi:hypothetical protein
MQKDDILRNANMGMFIKEETKKKKEITLEDIYELFEEFLENNHIVPKDAPSTQMTIIIGSKKFVGNMKAI